MTSSDVKFSAHLTGPAQQAINEPPFENQYHLWIFLYDTLVLFSTGRTIAYYMDLLSGILSIYVSTVALYVTGRGGATG